MTCITTIKEQFVKVLEYSQHRSDLNADAIFDKWQSAKQYFIDHWDGLTYEVEEPITFYLSIEEKTARYNEFIEAIDYNYGNYGLTEFLDWLTIDEVFDNHMSRDYWLTAEDKIAAGTKVSKAFKYFISNETALRCIQDQISTIIQEDKITGTLVLSVHPLDFLSTSENTYHWRSCHALDGDYRSGNLSYMVDSSTIVCYLRGANGQKLPNFPAEVSWNSKKWRMLLFLSDKRDALFAGRQYPFFSPSALDIVQEALLTSLDKRSRLWTPWYNDYLKKFPRANTYGDDFGRDTDLYSRYICMANQIYSMREIIKAPKRQLFFNDLTESSVYIPYYCWNRYAADGIQFHIGDNVPCLQCGFNNVRYSDSMVCEDCMDNYNNDAEPLYCEACERQIYEEDPDYYVMGVGITLCADCADTMTRLCERCHGRWMKQEITYDYDIEQHICPYCRADLNGEKTSLDEDDWDTLPF